jgi:uncharacterized protein
MLDRAKRTTSGRTEPLPRQPWLLRMKWSELLFAHWPVASEIVAQHLPRGLQLDSYDGQAWVGVVPFLISDFAPRACPAIPPLNRFLELNVRTYVIHEGRPGVWFFTMDAASRLAVRAARSMFYLPYMDASMSLTHYASGAIDYRSQRTHRGEPAARFEAAYQTTGQAFPAEPGTFEHWLTARYCLVSADRQGRLYRGEIDHEPWSLATASWQVRENTLGEAFGFDFSAEPHLLSADAIGVRAWLASRCT